MDFDILTFFKPLKPLHFHILMSFYSSYSRWWPRNWRSVSFELSGFKIANFLTRIICTCIEYHANNLTNYFIIKKVYPVSHWQQSLLWKQNIENYMHTCPVWHRAAIVFTYANIVFAKQRAVAYWMAWRQCIRNFQNNGLSCSKSTTWPQRIFSFNRFSVCIIF